jgi:hypothetical protein
MNRQDIYNKVRKHLLTQQEQSFCDDGETCAYRNSKGLKCAIGALIPDELYSVSWETMGIAEVLISNKRLLVHFEVECDADVDFLESLQNVHDTQSPMVWEHELNAFAYRYGFEVEDPTPWCSYGHRTEADCDCGPIADNN